MKYSLYLLILISIVFSSGLREWIDERSALIDKNSYILKFEYLVNKKKDKLNKNDLKTTEFHSINRDSTIIKFNNRITLCFDDRWEIIDLNSKQKFIEPRDLKFDNLKNKLSSIFTDKNFKIIKVSKNKYLLSLNDYYINMNIIYNKNNDYISQLSFYQAPYWIYIQNLTISSLDTIPYNYKQSNDYEVFDFR